MEKRVIVAIIASLAILVLYPYALKYFYPESAEVQMTQEAEVESPAGGETVSIPSAPTPETAVDIAAVEQTKKKPSVAERLVTIDTPLFTAEITNIGGGIKSWVLKDYRTEKAKDSPKVDLAATIATESTLRTLVSNGTREIVVFTPSTDSIELSGDESAELTLTGVTSTGVRVTKTFVFSGSSYMVEGSVAANNPTAEALDAAIETTIASSYGVKDSFGYHSGPVIMDNQEISRFDTGDPVTTGTGRPLWIGMEDKYFLAAIIPKGEADLGWRTDVPQEDRSMTSLKIPVTLGAGETSAFGYTAFIGPKNYNLLKSLDYSLADSIEFGWFSFLAKPLLIVLVFLQGYIGNYGIAIIILTVVIKILFYPLSKHSLKSMNDMKKLQPQMALIKEKYKDDKTQLNKEMMELYKRYKINPLSGCLPMLLQIPVFIGLYEALYVAIELRHAEFFLWITDLSSKDPYYITPVLMGVSMFAQQKMSPTSADPTQAKVMMFMPIIFTVMFLSFPSGLVIYWLVNNLLTIGQQYMIHRAPDTPAPKKAAPAVKGNNNSGKKKKK